MFIDIYCKRVFNYYDCINVTYKGIRERVTWSCATNMWCSKENVRVTSIWIFWISFQSCSSFLSKTSLLFFLLSCVTTFWKSLSFWSHPQIVFSYRLLSGALLASLQVKLCFYFTLCFIDYLAGYKIQEPKSISIRMKIAH